MLPRATDVRSGVNNWRDKLVPKNVYKEVQNMCTNPSSHQKMYFVQRSTKYLHKSQVAQVVQLEMHSAATRSPVHHCPHPLMSTRSSSSPRAIWLKKSTPPHPPHMPPYMRSPMPSSMPPNTGESFYHWYIPYPTFFERLVCPTFWNQSWYYTFTPHPASTVFHCIGTRNQEKCEHSRAGPPTWFELTLADRALSVRVAC